MRYREGNPACARVRKPECRVTLGNWEATIFRVQVGAEGGLPISFSIIAALWHHSMRRTVLQSGTRRHCQEGEIMEEHRREEWAWKIWPLLTFAARKQTILSYEDIQSFTGLATVSVGPIGLGPIAAYCMIHNLPVLTCVVVKRETGLPGEGLLSHIPKEDIPAEQHRCFVFDWANQTKPTVEQLRTADEVKFGKGTAA